MSQSTSSTSTDLRSLADRGRRCVLGHLGPMILHETNNVLTVMAGIRQLLRLGKDLPERAGPMIDGQMEKMENLLHWFRELSPEDGGAVVERSCAAVSQNLEALLRLGTKGRRLELACSGAEAERLGGGQVEVLSLGLLCGLFTYLPPRSPGSRVSITVELTRQSDVARLEASMTPCHGDPGNHPDLRLAFDLLETAGGALTCQGASGAELTLSLRVPLNA